MKSIATHLFLFKKRFCPAMLLSFAAFLLPTFTHAEDITPSPRPDPNLVGDHQREIILQIKFAADGKVSHCEVVKASGSPKLDKATVSFVRANWKMTSEAGRSARVPIDFSAVPKVASQPPKKTPASTSNQNNSVPRSDMNGYGSGGGAGYTGGSRGTP